MTFTDTVYAVALGVVLSEAVIRAWDTARAVRAARGDDDPDLPT